MKFLIYPLLYKIIYELSIVHKIIIKKVIFIIKLIFSLAKSLIYLVDLVLTFLFLQPTLIRQIGPNEFEELNKKPQWNDQYYV